MSLNRYAKKRGNLPLQFWARVQKSDGCWLWTGNRLARLKRKQAS